MKQSAAEPARLLGLCYFEIVSFHIHFLALGCVFAFPKFIVGSKRIKINECNLGEIIFRI